MNRAKDSTLSSIRVIDIDRNPENPRTLFRQEELDTLMVSIRRYGVQVPISVYRENKKYILIDGERRWMCSAKLGLDEIPALVQEKPTELDNLLLMFNIHGLREQWDLLTIALKLPRIVDLLSKKNESLPNEIELSEYTGMPRGTIRRCKLLMNLPQEYIDIIMEELKKPKPKQKLTEDFFIEMERALSTVNNYLPNVIDDIDRVRHVLISKYRDGVINNVVHFRDLSKIARAENVDASIGTARDAIGLIFTTNSVSIEEMYDKSVHNAYKERDIQSLISQIKELLMTVERNKAKKTLIKALTELKDLIEEIIRGQK